MALSLWAFFKIWAFSSPSPTGTLSSNVTSTSANRTYPYMVIRPYPFNWHSIFQCNLNPTDPTLTSTLNVSLGLQARVGEQARVEEAQVLPAEP